LTSTVLKQRYRTIKNPGNLNNEIGLPMTLWQIGDGHQRAVLEMGFYVPGEIQFLCELARPSVGVITNIGTVHAERAGSQEEIARGKAELVKGLPPAPEGTAILNYDDPLVRAMTDETDARIFFYGLNPQADLWADQVEGLGLDGIRFRLHYQNETIHLKVPLIGRHSVHTVLRAAAVGLIEGLSWEEISWGLRSEHTQLRLVAVRAASGAMILDDTYNASPKSMLADLNLLDEMAGRKIAVLGDMLELGQYEEQGHRKVGIRAAEVADVLVTVGKLGQLIARAAAEVGLKDEKIHSFLDCDEARDFLQNFLDENDVVLVKGSRGMRMDKIVAALELQND
jgi:UDP-N-acetylmuramoyl-tripeptide--D-alanyl-D-alanine ligase